MGAFKEIVVSFVIGFLTRVLDGSIKNEELMELGRKAGAFVTDNCKGKLGKGWDTIEDVVEDKAAVFFSGFRAGLDHDDKE